MLSVKSRLLAIIVLIPISYGYAAISIDGFSKLANDRFANDAQFIANSFDLSGIGIANDGRWVTMVSENVFLSANHFFPSNGTSVTFYSSNDADAGSLTRTIESSQRIGSSDIRIGTLNAGLSNAFTSYSFATDNTTNDNTGGGGPFGANSESFINSPYFEADAYLFGRSQSSLTVSQDMAVGRNKLDTWFDSITAAGITDDAMGSRIDTNGEANYLQYEAFLQVGDSGAPLMVEETPGSLTIVGLNWLQANDGSNDFNGFSYVGNYDGEIQSYIDANPVPEVRSFGLFAGMLAILSSTLCRRKAIM